MTIQLRPGQVPQEGYQNWDSNQRMYTCLICGKEVRKYALIYKGYCFCQDDLPTGWERWDGLTVKKKPFE